MSDLHDANTEVTWVHARHFPRGMLAKGLGCYRHARSNETHPTRRKSRRAPPSALGTLAGGLAPLRENATGVVGPALPPIGAPRCGLLIVDAGGLEGGGSKDFWLTGDCSATAAATGACMLASPAALPATGPATEAAGGAEAAGRERLSMRGGAFPAAVLSFSEPEVDVILPGPPCSEDVFAAFKLPDLCARTAAGGAVALPWTLHSSRTWRGPSVMQKRIVSHMLPTLLGCHVTASA